MNIYEVQDNDYNNDYNNEMNYGTPNNSQNNEMSEESNGDALETFDSDNAIEKHVLRVLKIHENFDAFRLLQVQINTTNLSTFMCL
ncbi:11808_t:CDS:2 [Scutellospora calospora]|uniref:11808_t:CDS:1 n=1 Tax=Scutellospora calospora TaxID=85575 RepID=A0ACA9JXY2_9GLOM|nr:11808_t:CDS:2 [Scutellospora calospora]